MTPPSQKGIWAAPPGGRLSSGSRSTLRHQIPTGLHANLSEGRPVGPARHGASSLLSPEGFFLGKMGFREAVAAKDVALSQVRKGGCRRRTPPKAPPRGYHDAIRGGNGRGLWMLPWFQLWSSHAEARG